jgi:hypothetical protein
MWDLPPLIEAAGKILAAYHSLTDHHSGAPSAAYLLRVVDPISKFFFPDTALWIFFRHPEREWLVSTTQGRRERVRQLLDIWEKVSVCSKLGILDSVTAAPRTEVHWWRSWSTLVGILSIITL